MKVWTAFSLSETELRTIRAAVGRGGRATRKECVVFIDRAVRDALRRAPDPKPARRKRLPAPPAAPVPDAPPVDESTAASRNRDRIRAIYVK